MVSTSTYNINVTSTNKWAAYENKAGVKTINNRSSVGHNILTNEPNAHSGGINMGLLDKAVCNRRKGVAEFGDIQRPTAMNPNQDFLKAYDKDNNAFKRKNGVFANLYDAAHRFGIDKPFVASGSRPDKTTA